MSEPEGAMPKFIADLLGWYSLTMLALGARTGLLHALQEGSGTAEDIAARAGVDTRNALEWLRALTAAGYATAHDGHFSLGEEAATVLSPAFFVDARAIIDFAQGVPAVFDEVAQAIHTGRGVRASAYQETLGQAAAKINTPIYAGALVEEWIAGVSGLTERLSQGGRVADLACGSGEAAAMIAKAFPLAQVIGYDLDPTVVAQQGLPDNVELRQADVRALPEDERFDLVTCLDSLHHLGDPGPVVERVRRVLKPGGVFLIAEEGLSGDLDRDKTDALSIITYAAGVLYCLQENLAAGGPGLTGADGPAWVTGALSRHGFSNVTVTRSPTGFNVIVGVA